MAHRGERLKRIGIKKKALIVGGWGKKIAGNGTGSAKKR
jgi:hypothetical protein